ncbi:MAG TPA: electron transfer flavoprotein subunit beta/FixA family protein [Oscillospiraceae bacterium]|nr:electron transfer flavoprotein subunit beta/FixA family protein [Oscillospiraceae bacterium]HPS75608.1 electron transfer flavoprotein subunit beta/FixA family protein [Oscillospiraceae bacterium]
MKILVFVKQVPDTDDVKLDPRTGNLMRDGVESVINPLDANGVEAALELKEKYGGTVTAISMGPPQADDVLKKALAMGCDESVLLSDRALGGADTLATGYPLAKAAEKIGGYDLLICGRHAVDAETAQTGPIIAAFLGIPQVTLVDSVSIDGEYAVCRRVLPDRFETVRVKMPALITVCSEMNTPRYPTPINIMKALRKPRYVWNSRDINCDPEMIGAAGSPSSNKEIFEPPKRNTDTRYFTGEIEEMASAIADTLEAEKLI